jgi:hypothetical protein
MTNAQFIIFMVMIVASNLAAMLISSTLEIARIRRELERAIRSEYTPRTWTSVQGEETDK